MHVISAHDSSPLTTNKATFPSGHWAWFLFLHTDVSLSLSISLSLSVYLSPYLSFSFHTHTHPTCTTMEVHLAASAGSYCNLLIARPYKTFPRIRIGKLLSKAVHLPQKKAFTYKKKKKKERNLKIDSPRNMQIKYGNQSPAKIKQDALRIGERLTRS